MGGCTSTGYPALSPADLAQIAGKTILMRTETYETLRAFLNNSVFGAANRLTAVDAAKQSKNKKIDLSINKANGFDVLTCVNSCDRVPSRVGDELETTKTDTAFHGLGVKSMKRIVKKYKGNFEWRYDDAANEFAVHIVF